MRRTANRKGDGTEHHGNMARFNSLYYSDVYTNNVLFFCTIESGRERSPGHLFLLLVGKTPPKPVPKDNKVFRLLQDNLIANFFSRAVSPF
jgi:hypothetical protein